MVASSTIHATIPVCLSKQTYSLLLGNHLTSEIQSTLNRLCAEGYQIAVLVDQSIVDHYAALLCTLFKDFPMHVLPSGESTKSFVHYQACCEFLVEQRIGRKAALFCVGGGVVGDLGGFVAATYCRGIDYYSIPTTLLAMVDSSIGGKTSIDLPQGKNLVGAFHQPRGVFIDLQFLKTLPKRDFNAGMAEVIKYALIEDPDFFEKLLQQPPVTAEQTEFLFEIIQRSCKIKAKIVQADEKESDDLQQRVQLNLGHTFGHAIEKVLNYQCLHGEAVGLGLLLAARYSQCLGWADQGLVDSVCRLLEHYSLPVKLHNLLQCNELMQVMWLDKKARNGKIRLVLLEEIGCVRLQLDVDENLLKKVWIEAGAIL